MSAGYAGEARLSGENAAGPRDLADAILAWYDRGARRLAWRVGPTERAAGHRPDPYRVWLSEIMLQQTTAAAVTGYFLRFTSRWPRVEDLAAASDAEVMAAWAGLGYYARARNLIACAREIAGPRAGRFPDTESELLALPGIGPYTAAAIAAIAFDRPAVVVDGNVERVVARLCAVEEPLPRAKATLRRHAARLTPERRPGDYAQAVMDLGATICTPRRPACGICPLSEACEGRRRGIADALPRKAGKLPKPVRLGTAYLGFRADGAVLVEQRPATGLLGGMLGLPGTAWSEAPPAPHPPFAAEWRGLGAEVRHTFTHFHLRLRLEAARVPQDFAAPAGSAFRPAAEALAAMPTVMRKALRLGLATA